MVRFSDFIKREKKPEESVPGIKPEDSHLPKGEEKADDAALSVSGRIYREALNLVKDCISKAQVGEPIDGRMVAGVAVPIVNQIVLGDRELVVLSTTHTKENYLFGHLVNTAILSVETGLGMGYTKAKLNALAVCGFLYDIGMVRVMQLANLPRLLTEGEFAEVKKHADYGAEMLKQSTDIDEVAIIVASQHHERLDGSGYPKGLRSDGINEFARIIGLVDVYEAMTHPRAYRERHLHHEAIKWLLEEGENIFDATVVKSLIKRIGIYPIGSWVELNTSEIGKVINASEEFPLRPTVEIAFDFQGRKFFPPKVIELSRLHSLYIKRPIDETALGITGT